MAAFAATERPSGAPAVSQGDMSQAVVLIGIMAIVAVPAGLGVAHIVQDTMVGIVAGALAALLLVAFLQMVGVLGGR